MAAIVTSIDSQDFTLTGYLPSTVSLISNSDINLLLTSQSNIECFIYTPETDLILQEYNYSDYTSILSSTSAISASQPNSITLQVEDYLLNNGFNQGEYIVYYNFLNNKIGSELEKLYISEISSDRTEVRLKSSDIDNITLVDKTTSFIQERENSSYFLDFYINFQDNNLAVANNITLDNEDFDDPSILVKLYNPLPDKFDLNTVLWVVTNITQPQAYKVIFEDEIFEETFYNPIKGPNFNLDIKDQVNNSTNLLSYNNLINTPTSSSLDQINNLLNRTEIDINVDYTQYSEFVHFSSAQTRLENFYYKVGLIESYSSSIAILNNTTSSANVSGSTAIYKSKINNIIKNFDGYDYFLYYDNSPYAWPKTTTTPPYKLAKKDTTVVNNWFGNINENSPTYGGHILSASLYDNENKDNLKFSIPEYLRDDSNNAQYELFIDMVAQHYDNIWVYHNEITKKYDADNRLEYGVSKDIVADAIKDFGIKLYQNNFSNNDLYTAFLGLTPDGGLFPFPNITGSLPTPTGFEYIDQFISASNDVIPLDDVNKSLYKRIYHNIPYLLKAKGTLPGLRALITSYGIPDTILRINEYGGKDKINVNDWDHWQNEFNYAFHTSGDNYIGTQWYLNHRWTGLTFPSGEPPKTLQFRFKAEKFPPTNYSQSLWRLGIFGTSISSIVLEYTGSGFLSGSYSGSIKDPEYQYANLKYINQDGGSASIYLPFYNDDWWSVMATFDSSSNVTLYAGNKIYEGGENGTSIGFFSSSIVTGSGFDTFSLLTNASSFGSSSTIDSPAENFSGSFQEIRYYNVPISESVFKNYVMNPHSIEGNSINSSPHELAFRAPLGGELYTGSVSIHPKVTGSWNTSQSFFSNSNFTFDSTPTFLPNVEYFFADQPIAGLRNIVKDKIRIENNVMPEGDTLSPFMSLSQMSNVSQSYTPGINYLEVAFSPQNEINEDIMDQIGYFNMGEYIGDPRLRSSSAITYPDLDNLRDDYFEKYTKNYGLTDFIRLIKFFDNSLFKMIKDFVPARTSLSSGVVIKQHLLERNKYPQPQASHTDVQVSGTLKPQWNDYNDGRVVNTVGGTGGSFDQFNTSSNISQSWYETVEYLSGSITTLHDSQTEFYDGEFSGSNLVVTTQSLSTPYPLDFQGFEYTPILYSNNSNYYNIPATSQFSEAQFLDNRTTPNPGEMLILSPYTIVKGSKEFGNVITSYSDTYIKINKVDCNGKNNKVPLEQITQLLIKYPTNSTYSTYKVYPPTEKPNYFLYRVNRGGNVNSGPFDIDSEIKNYYVSASYSGSQTITGTGVLSKFDTVVGNSSGFLSASSATYNLELTPNIPLQYSASFTTSGSGGIGVFIAENPIKSISTNINQFNISAGSNITTTISSSYLAFNGDKLYFGFIGPDLTIKSSSFIVTQSTSPQYENVCDSVILEPYITLPNYLYTDFNPLFNNFSDARLGTLFQDIDYSTGLTEPVNFDLIISESAVKAAVQDSNYTLKRSTIPRYDGSKSTSQFLNKWTPGDSGTFGKTPTVDSLKTVIAYCDWMGGWTPDRMNASTAHVLYLIDSDGNIGIPNTSENSLPNIQGAFQTGERFRVSSRTIGSGEADPLRTVIRGGTRIEPILYTQSGSNPGAKWSTTIELEDIQITEGSVTGNYQNQGSISQPNYGLNLRCILNSSPNNISYINNGTYNTKSYKYYQIPLDAVQDAISYQISVSINFLSRRGRNFWGTAPEVKYRVGLILKSEIDTLSFTQKEFSFAEINELFTEGAPRIDSGMNITAQFTIPPELVIEGKKISIEYQVDPITNTTYNNEGIRITGGYYNITQTPLPTLPITIGENNIWGYYDKINYPYVITSSNAVSESLGALYGDHNVKQDDIPNSGFEPIALPWSIKYGDEFRFEGDERFTYMVGKVFGPNEGSGSRLTQTGSIEVQFNKNLPVSASILNFNLDHFLIRRYIDDPSQIIFEGFKPLQSQGPYILTPEYSTKDLSTNIDDVITNLKEKGLITGEEGT